MRSQIRDVLGRKLRRDRIHQRILAAPVLERVELQLDISRLLARKIGDGVAHADAERAVTCGTHGRRLGLAGLEVRRGCDRNAGDHDEQANGNSHRSLRSMGPERKA